MSLGSVFDARSGFRHKLQEAATEILAGKIAALEMSNPGPVQELKFGERVTGEGLKAKSDWGKLVAARTDLENVNKGGIVGSAVAFKEVLLQKPGKLLELMR